MTWRAKAVLTAIGTLLRVFVLLQLMRPDTRRRSSVASASGSAVEPTNIEIWFRRAEGDQRIEHLDGINDPENYIVSAANAELDDDETVIGIRVGSRHRAYRQSAFLLYAAKHVVNDIVDGIPVSVTHCDRLVHTRVVTTGQPGERIRLQPGGIRSNELILRYGELFCTHESPQLTEATNLIDPPFETMTWKAWRTKHPDTDVYVGYVGKRPAVPSDRGAGRTGRDASR